MKGLVTVRESSSPIVSAKNVRTSAWKISITWFCHWSLVFTSGRDMGNPMDAVIVDCIE